MPTPAWQPIGPAYGRRIPAPVSRPAEGSCHRAPAPGSSFEAVPKEPTARQVSAALAACAGGLRLPLPHRGPLLGLAGGAPDPARPFRLRRSIAAQPDRRQRPRHRQEPARRRLHHHPHRPPGRPHVLLARRGRAAQGDHLDGGRRDPGGVGRQRQRQGSYESWSDVVRGTVVSLGLPDPAETRESLEAAADPEAAARTALVAGLAEVFRSLGRGASAGEILKELISSPNGYQALRSALEESFTRLKSGELPTARSLGRKLRSLQDRIVDGRAIVQLARDSRGIVWGIRRSADSEAAD